jgi:hypothetical protein
MRKERKAESLLVIGCFFQSNKMHENMDVPYVVSFSIFPILFDLNTILGKTTN